MHILHIIDTLGLGGAERMLVDIANATVADGHRVSVCVTRSDITLAPELHPSIDLLVLARRRRFSVAAAARLAKWSRSQGAEVLHVHMRHTLTFVLLLRAVRALRLPIVFHDHYGTIEIDTAVPAWFRVGHRLIAHYVGVYERLSEWARDAGMPAAKTTTIANAIDLARLTPSSLTDVRAELEIPKSAVLGVMVATLRPDKSIETLIDAVALSKHRARLRIIVVGTTGDEAYASRCRARVRAHQLDGVITFTGGRTDVPAVLPSADLALLSSKTESGPLVLVEYLAAGLPIVSTLVGDIGKRLAAMGVPGFVPPMDPAAFAAALDELIELPSPDRRVRGALGHRALLEEWNIKVVMPRWYEVYRKVAHD